MNKVTNSVEKSLWNHRDICFLLRVVVRAVPIPTFLIPFRAGSSRRLSYVIPVRNRKRHDKQWPFPTNNIVRFRAVPFPAHADPPSRLSLAFRADPPFHVSFRTGPPFCANAVWFPFWHRTERHFYLRRAKNVSETRNMRVSSPNLSPKPQFRCSISL